MVRRDDDRIVVAVVVVVVVVIVVVGGGGNNAMVTILSPFIPTSNRFLSSAHLPLSHLGPQAVVLIELLWCTHLMGGGGKRKQEETRGNINQCRYGNGSKSCTTTWQSSPSSLSSSMNINESDIHPFSSPSQKNEGDQLTYL